jgi:hypothetical protein
MGNIIAFYCNYMEDLILESLGNENPSNMNLGNAN